jgi:tetratricopeptide (TPR) repeat protein
MLKRLYAAVLLASTFGFCQQHDHAAAPADDGPAPLLDGLGHLHHTITTSKPEAQRYFDQGLTLVYGFNYDEATRSFRYAAKLDPKCAMAYWGIALTLGPNYNDPDINADRRKSAYEASQKAVSLAGSAKPAEQAFIRALAKRYSADPKADQKKLSVDYAQAMRDVMRQNPADSDAAVLFADAAMNVRPWQLWKHDGQAEDGTREIVDVLEGVLKRDPNHIGANHLFIHAVEASQKPEQALASAKRLTGLAPGAGHLVHMPAHIYIRTGDYHGASLANQQAVGIDQGYVNKYHVTGMYPVMYYTHNLQFLAVSSSMEGRFDEANRIATKVVTGMTPFAKENPMAEWFLPTKMLVLIRFRQWEDLAQVPEPDKSLRSLHAVWHFGRGMAFTGLARLDKAAAERDALTAEVKALPPDAMLGFNSAQQVLGIAAGMLDGYIARGQRNYKRAAELLNKAAQAEDKLNYDEPPDWYLPPRESLGAVLFTDGRYADAEAAFRAELKAHAKNPRALFGLAQCLEAQKKTAEAAEIRKEFEAGWKNADVKLKMSDL